MNVPQGKDPRYRGLRSAGLLLAIPTLLIVAPRMGLEFLTRVRRATIWLGVTTAVLVATYRGPAQGLAVVLGAAWSLVNLFLLEKLVVAATGADRETPSALRRAALSVTGLVLL